MASTRTARGDNRYRARDPQVSVRHDLAQPGQLQAAQLVHRSPLDRLEAVEFTSGRHGVSLRGAERLGCTVVPVSGGLTERQVTLIADFEPRIILVTPSYLSVAVVEPGDVPRSAGKAQRVVPAG